MIRLTSTLATEFIESVMDCPIDLATFGRVEAFILDRDVEEVRTMLDEFLAVRGISVDPDSVQLRPDKLDLCDDDCCQIIILTDDRVSLT